MQRRWLGLGATVAIALALMITMALGSGGVRADTPPPADPSEQIKELATRLLSPPYAGPDEMTVELLPGALPGDPKLDLPIPEGGTLVGSALRRMGKDQAVNVVIDAAGSPRDVMSFYARALPDKGWTPAAFDKGGGGGFQPRNVAQSAFYCGPDNASWMNVFASQRDGKPVDVRIDVNYNEYGPCQQGSEPPKPPVGRNQLPPLYPPDGVDLEMMSSGGGGGPDIMRFSSSALSKSDVTHIDLHQHFAAQLEEAGWVKVADGTNNTIAWSTWTLPGEGDWTGFLYILKTPGDGHLDLYVQAESTKATPMNGGWGVSSSTVAPMAPAVGAAAKPASSTGAGQ